MAIASGLGRQLAETADLLRCINCAYALIGGLALAPHNVIRATQDIDLLVPLTRADDIHGALLARGYSCLHRNDDAANYALGSARLDFLYASRPISQRLLDNARELDTSLGSVRVISLEGLIGFKLQGWVNDKRRTQDLEDIRALLRANRSTVRMDEVRQYFQLFERESLLDELIASL